MLTTAGLDTVGPWSRLNSDQLPASEGGCMFAHGDYIYYLTGQVDVPSTSSKLWRYSITSGTWGTVNCPMPHGQLRTCSTVDNKVYFFGGIPESTQVWQFDLLTLGWTPLGNFTYPFYAGISKAIGTDIYIIGGYSGSAPINRLTRYNTLTDAKTTRAVLPDATYGPSVFSFNTNTFIVTGGVDNLGNTYDQRRLLYAIDTDRWTSNQMTGAIHPGGFAAFTQTPTMGYVFGGVSNRTPSNKLSTFEVVSYKTVPKVGTQPGSRSRASMVSHNGKLYLLGGVNDAGRLSDFWVWSE